jgi:uncharacterized membrane protein
VLDHSVLIAGVLCANVALSEWLARRTVLRHLGSALLVIVVTAVEANLGLLPTYSPDVAVYEGVFTYVAPLSIFWLLLQVHLREVWRAGVQMLALFAIGAVGVTVGVLAGMALLGGEGAFGERFAALGGMLAGTYTGGSVNFNAVALHYRVMEDGLLYAGASAVDNAATTFWMIGCVALPKLLGGLWPKVRRSAWPAAAPIVRDASEADVERAGPADLALVLALGAVAVWGSEVLAELLEGRVPSVLILTTVALALAQFGPVQRLRGYRSLGLLAVYVFLAVIGALCDLGALAGLGGLALHLCLLVATILLVHGGVLFGAAALLRLDLEGAAVASQACVGGGTSALALARSLGRPDLTAPAILAGSLGTAVGTYLGFAVSGWLA